MKLYTKTVCPKCMVAKQILSGIDYEVINTDQDAKAREKLINLGFMAAPILEHEGKFYTNNSDIQELVESL